MMFRSLIFIFVFIVGVFADPYDVKSYNYYEKLVYEDLLKSGVDFNAKKVGIKNVKDNIVVGTSDGRIITYLEVKDGKVLPHYFVIGLRDSTIEYISYLDYVEIEPYIMYNKSDILNGKVKKGKKPIDIYSIEYYQIWMDLLFYRNAFTRSEYIKRAHTWNGGLLSDEYLDRLVNRRDFKLKDFLYIWQEKMFNGALYKKYLPIVKSYLPKQCADTRFSVFKGDRGVYSVKMDGKKLIAIEKPAKNIDKEEIEWYFKYGYIDERLKDECLEIIKKRDGDV